MKKYFAFLVVLSVFAARLSAERVVVINDADSSPIAGATVFSARGLILGMTDADGLTPELSDSDFPLSIRSIAFKEGIIDKGTDTLRMKVDTYDLPGVMVKPGERPVTRVMSYVREYCSGVTSTDTMMLYSEYMLESYDVENKVKGFRGGDRYPKIKAVKRYARLVDSVGRDSVVMSDDRHSELSELAFVPGFLIIPVEVVEEPDAIKNGAVSDTVQGKYGPATITNKNDNRLLIIGDMLSSYKNHKYSPNIFKLLGMTTEMSEWLASLAYRPNDTGKYDIRDCLYSTTSIKALGKGKWIKKGLGVKEPVELSCYIELYPVEINYLTLDEYKEMRDDRNKIEFKRPVYAQPLLPSVSHLIEHVNKEVAEK